MKRIENSFIEHQDYCEIVVHSRKHGDWYFKIDKEDFEKCKNIHWSLTRFKTKTYNGFYCASTDGFSPKILLHRYLMNTPRGMYTDHISGDITDNRKSNLRNCTPSENNRNARKGARNKSGHKGVYWYPYRNANKWLASICVGSKLKHLGFFDSYEEAVDAREAAEEMYHGEFRKIS